MTSRTHGGGRTRYLAIFALFFVFSFAPIQAQAADGFFENLWCDISGFFGFACERPIEVVETIVSTTIPPAPTEIHHYTVATSTNGTPIYTTVVENNYITNNPTTIVREYHSSGGGGSDGVSMELFRKQVDRIFDSIGESADGVRDNMNEAFAGFAASFSTALLTVTGNASVGGDLDVTGTITAGTLNVTSLSSYGALTGPYFTATSTSGTNTFAGTLSVTGTSTLATTTVGDLITKGPLVDVRAYGAVGDGVTDDTSAIQDAIDSITSDDGGTIFFPVGTYKISSTLQVSYDNVHLVGASRGTTLAADTSLGANPVLQFSKTGSSQISRNVVQDLTITLTSINSTGIYFLRALEPTVERVFIQGNPITGNAAVGIYMNADTAWAGGLRVSKSRLLWLKTGIKLTGTSGLLGATAASITDNWILGNAPVDSGSIGIHFTNEYAGSGSKIEGNDLENWDIAISDAGLQSMIVANRFENNATYDIQLTQSGAQTNIIGNTYSSGVNNSTARKVTYLGSRNAIFENGEIYVGGYNGGSSNAEGIINIAGSNVADGPSLRLTNNFISSSPTIILQANGSSATNAFLESLTANEATLSSIVALKMGTVGNLSTSLYTNSLPRITVTGSGSVGIGTTTPNTKLTVAASGANGFNLDADASNATLSSRLFLSTGTAGQSLALTNNAGNWSFQTGATPGSSSGTERLHIASTGNVGIGTTSPTYKLEVIGAARTVGDGFGFEVADTGAAYTARLAYRSSLLGLSNIANLRLSGGTGMSAFSVSDYDSAIRFIVNRTGNIGIGTTTPSARLSVTQSAQTAAGGFWLAASDNTDFRSQFMNTSGVMSFYGGDTAGTLNTATLNAAGEWTNASDIAYKENVENLAYGLDAVLALTPRSYDIKNTNDHRIGFIAQEVEEIIPEVVGGVEGSKGISYGNLIAVVVKAIQELAEQVSGFADSITTAVLNATNVNAEQVDTKTLCLDGVCITKSQLQDILDDSGQNPTPQPSEPDPVPEDPAPDTETPEEPEADESTDEEQEPTEEPTPEPIPEAEETAEEPNPEPEQTPEPEPGPESPAE